jgi:peptide/nickel transport system substrate-binding protein
MRDVNDRPEPRSMLSSITSRRRFLALAGGTTAMVAMGSLLAACEADDDDVVTDDAAADDGADVPADEPDTDETDDAEAEPETPDDGEDDAAEDEPAEDDSEPVAGGRLVAVATVEPETLNPYLTQLVVGGDILSLTMDTLLQSDDEGVYHARLAESYEFSDDGLVCTLHLREDVDFHDGSHFTAEDLQASYNTIMDSDFGAFSQTGWSELTDFEIVDDYTVEMTLGGPYAPFISNIGETFVISRSLVEDGYESFREEFGRLPWGTGPYIFEEWSSGEQVRVTANNDYWGGAPNIEEIIYRFVPNSNTLVVQMQTGEADLTAYAGAEQYPEFEQMEDKNVIIRDGQAWFHLDLKNLGFLMDRNVRQALDYATPKEQIVDQILDGLGTVSIGDIAPISWAFNPNIEPRPYDLDRARELLEESGWEEGSDGVREKDGDPLFIELWGVSGDSQTERMLQVIANSWEQVGFDVDLNLQDIRTIWGPEGYQFTDVETAGAYSWYNYNDPDNMFYWHSSQIPDDPQGTGGNLVAYFNEFEYQDEIDDLTERAATTVDQDERRELYWEIQELLHEELPVIFIYWQSQIFVSPNNLSGFDPNAFTRLFYNVNEWHFTS